MCRGKTRWTTDLIGALALVVLFSHASLVWAEGRQVYKQVVHGVALVITPKSEGTAWVVDRQRKMLVTAHHVIANPATGKAYDEVKVVFPVFEDGRPIAERTYYRDHASGLAVRGVVLDGESEHDLAVIVLDKLPAQAEALKLAKGSPSPGDVVHAVGNPGASDALWVYNRGAVRQVYRTDTTIDGERVVARVVETQNPINPGDSGGPLLNEDGEVVGVHRCIHKDAQLVCISIDVTEVKSLLAVAVPLADARSAGDLMKRAKHYAARGRSVRALADLDAVLKQKPQSVPALMLRAQLGNQVGRHSQAFADANQVLKLDEDNAEALLERGRANVGLNRCEEAVDDFTAALKKDESLLAAYLHRALAQRRLDKADLALADLDEVLKRQPKYVAAYKLRALIHADAGRDAQALADLNEAVRLAPRDAGGYFLRAQFLVTAGEATAALMDLNAALKLDPRLGAAYELRGDLLAAAKLYQGALKDYRAALILSEDTATAERIRSKGMRVATLMQKELPVRGTSEGR